MYPIRTDKLEIKIRTDHMEIKDGSQTLIRIFLVIVSVVVFIVLMFSLKSPTVKMAINAQLAVDHVIIDNVTKESATGVRDSSGVTVISNISNPEQMAAIATNYSFHIDVTESIPSTEKPQQYTNASETILNS